MLNLDQYSSLGAALRDALDRWGDETCLIESDRDRERTRLTYSDFKELALPLARALEDAELHAGERAAITGTIHYLWAVKKDTFFPVVYLAVFGLLLGYRVISARRQSPRAAHPRSRASAAA